MYMILIPWSNGSKLIHVVLSNWCCTIQTAYCIWYQHKMHVLLQKQRFSEFAIICWEPVWKLLIDLILSWYQFDIVLMSDLCKIYKKSSCHQFQIYGPLYRAQNIRFIDVYAVWEEDHLPSKSAHESWLQNLGPKWW